MQISAGLHTFTIVVCKMGINLFYCYWTSVTIFIEDNQSDSELTRVQKIVLYGTT